jgi:hypothetical protein
MNELSGPHFLPIVILCTLHLATGFAVGLFVADGYRRKKPRSNSKSRLERSLRLYQDGFECVSQHAGKLSSLATAQRERIPEDFIGAVHELAKSTKEIQEHIKRIEQSVPQPKHISENKQPAMSTGELRKLVRLSQPNEPDPDRLQRERYAYTVPQWMGRCVGNRLPAPEDFERVMCCDISLDGISFYADDVQIGQSVVIAIGSDEAPAFVLAEIRHRRVLSVNEQLTYRVGCRFIRRLSETKDRGIVEGYRQTLFCDQPAATAD